LIIDNGLLKDIYSNWLRPVNTLKEDNPNFVTIQRGQIYIARLVAHLCKLDKDHKKKLIDEGWLLILQSWANSNNKELRLATINALNDLLGEETIAVRIFQDYGTDLFVELSEIADIEVIQATENLLQRFKDGILSLPFAPPQSCNTPIHPRCIHKYLLGPIDSYQARHAPDALKLDDNFQFKT